MRIEKCKMGAVSRIEKHHERKKDVYKSNPDIDVSRSDLNFHITATRITTSSTKSPAT